MNPVDIFYEPLLWAFAVPTFICALLVFAGSGPRLRTNWPKVIAFWFVILVPCVAVTVMLTK
jgi:hypothetical protein